MELVPPYNDGSESPTQSKRRKGSPPSLSMGANSNAATSSASLPGRPTMPPRRPSPLYSATEQHQPYLYGAQNQHSSYSQQNQQYSSNYPHVNPQQQQQQQQQQQHWQPQQQHQQQQQQPPSSRHSQRDIGIFRPQQAYPQPPDNAMYCPESSFVPSSSLPHSRHSPWNSSGPPHGLPQHHHHPQQQQQPWSEFSQTYYDGPPQNGGDTIDHEERGNFNSNNNNNNMKGRGKYVCGKCGAPKKGHVCPYQPKLKRRADEPPPEMKNAAVQVEMDELMVIRRLNLEIQGFPESYLAGPLELLQDNVYSETYEGSLFSSSAPLFSNSTTEAVVSRNAESNMKGSPS